MSYIKQSLPEDIDVTDIRDSGQYDLVIDEPTRSDWAMAELSNVIGTLEKFGAHGYVSELKEHRARLQTIIENTLKPF